MATLKLRGDLVARETGPEDGHVFFDITDPRSGNTLRLYEHEWALARRLDGAGSYDEVAAWARRGNALGFSPSPRDIADYARTLAGLGFFDDPSSVSALPIAGPGGGDETSFAELDSMRQPASSSIHGTTVPGGPPAAVLAELRAGDAGAPDLLRAPASAPPEASAAPTAKTAVAMAPPQVVAAVAAAAASAAPSKPVAGTPAAAAKPPAAAQKSSGGLVGALVLALLVVALAVVYFFVITPAFAPAHVVVRSVSAPRDVVKYAESKGAAKQAAPVVLSFGVGGKVADVVPAGTQVTPGKTLASLDITAELEKQLADVRDRETYYDNALKTALAKNKASAAKAAGAKVKEKKDLREQLEAKVKQARIIAEGIGSVAEVTAAVGNVVAAGAPVLKLADRRLLADVKVAAADGALFAVGSTVSVSADGKQTFPARVLGVEGEVAHLELDDSASAAGIKDGSALQVVKSRVPNVTALPREAVVKSQGGVDQVFVLAGDVVQARPVRVVDRTASEVLVAGDALVAADRVVLSPQPSLKDGQKATTAP